MKKEIFKLTMDEKGNLSYEIDDELKNGLSEKQEKEMIDSIEWELQYALFKKATHGIVSTISPAPSDKMFSYGEMERELKITVFITGMNDPEREFDKGDITVHFKPCGSFEVGEVDRTGRDRDYWREKNLFEINVTDLIGEFYEKVADVIDGHKAIIKHKR